MKHVDFVQQFKDIRPQLNWRRFEREDWRIQVRILELSREATFIYSPWHRDASGNICLHSHPDAAQINLWEAINDDRIISHFDLRANSSVPSDLFPGYALPDNQVLLLDGNHRVAGHLIARRDIRIEIATIVGPIEEDALPDLLYWTRT